MLKAPNFQEEGSRPLKCTNNSRLIGKQIKAKNLRRGNL